MKISIWKTTVIPGKLGWESVNIWILQQQTPTSEFRLQNTCGSVFWQGITSFPVRILLEYNQCIKDTSTALRQVLDIICFHLGYPSRYLIFLISYYQSNIYLSSNLDKILNIRRNFHLKTSISPPIFKRPIIGVSEYFYCFLPAITSKIWYQLSRTHLQYLILNLPNVLPTLLMVLCLHHTLLQGILYI